MGAFQTEHEFELPKGYVDAEGNLHRKGRMRLATAEDEIEPMQDAQVQSNPAYLAVAILARVVTHLGTLKTEEIDTQLIRKLFSADFAFLQDLYNRINSPDGEGLPPGEV